MGGPADLDQAISRWDDPQSVMHRIVRGALNLIEDAEGATVQLLDGEGQLALVCVEGLGPAAGGIRLAPVGSLSGLALTSQTAQRADDTEVDARADRQACRQVGARSLVCVPLAHGSSQIGVVSVMSTRPDAFDDEDVDTLSELAGFMSVLVATLVRSANVALVTPPVGAAANGGVAANGGAAANGRPLSPASRVAAFVSGVLDPHLADRADARARIEQVLDRRALQLVFQPIMSLARGTTVAIEALARFPGPPDRPPDRWFDEAHAVGLGVELELLAIEEALAASPARDPKGRITVPVYWHVITTATGGANVSTLVPAQMEVLNAAFAAKNLTLTASVANNGTQLQVASNGYGSAEHLAAIATHGPSAEHRLSFLHLQASLPL